MVVFVRQFIDKPGSVVDDHLSSLVVAYQIKRISICGRAALIQISLQPTGFTFTPCHHDIL